MKYKRLTITTCFLISMLTFLIPALACRPRPSHETPTLKVTEVRLGTYRFPDWVENLPSDYRSRVLVTIVFNRAVDRNTVDTPATLRIDVANTSDGLSVNNVPGQLHWKSDSKEVVFISNQQLSNGSSGIISIGGGDNLRFTIFIVGSGAVINVKDSNGEVLDGDGNDTPGGDYIEEIDVVT